MRSTPGARAVAWALLLLAVPLAGCLAEPVDEVTAREHREVAEERALAWHDGRRLHSAAAVEGPMRWSWMRDDADAVMGELAGLPFWSVTGDDAEVPDGRAELWAYRYKNFIDDRGFLVVVDRTGTVVHTQLVQNPPYAIPVGRWPVDSDGAVRAARNATAADADGGGAGGGGAGGGGGDLGAVDGQVSAVAVLARDTRTGDNVWRVSVGGEERVARVVVDAETGQVRSVQGP